MAPKRVGPRFPRAEKLAPLARQPDRPPVEIDTKLAFAAGATLVAFLVGFAVLHVSWLLGGSWGSDAVLGEAGARSLERGDDGAVAGIWLIVVLLLLCAAIVAGRMGLLGSKLGTVYRWGARALFAVFFTRAILGFISSGVALGGSAGDHAKWDLLLLSPLALVAAVLVGLVALSALGPGEGRPSSHQHTPS